MSNEITKYSAVPTLSDYAVNLDKSLQFANVLIQTQMVPNHFKKPQEVVAAILYGQELGFAPMQALQAVNVIQGKPTLSAEALKALIIKEGGKIETIHWDENICTLKGIRGEWKEEVSFTMKDASLMGLSSKDNWRKMPKAMLYARCVSIIARNMFADVTKGFYTKEEMLDVTPSQYMPRPTQIEKSDSRPALDPVEVIEGEVVNTQTGEIIENTVNYNSDPIDWTQYKFKYHLPFKKNGVDMDAVRKYVKDRGWKWRPSKDKSKNPIEGGDDCWYTNDDSEKLKEYKRDNAEFNATPANVFEGDDIPF